MAIKCCTFIKFASNERRLVSSTYVMVSYNYIKTFWRYWKIIMSRKVFLKSSGKRISESNHSLLISTFVSSVNESKVLGFTAENFVRGATNVARYLTDHSDSVWSVLSSDTMTIKPGNFLVWLFRCYSLIVVQWSGHVRHRCHVRRVNVFQ